MAKKVSFNELVESIQDAFIRVNDMSEQQHIGKLSEYFEKDGTPKTFDMQYPYFDENGVPAYRFVSIPQICLVPISSLKLDEIQVDFKVQIYGEVPVKEGEKTTLGYIPHGGTFRNKEDSYANIKLKFVSQEPPEGLMRIRDQFTKVTL